VLLAIANASPCAGTPIGLSVLDEIIDSIDSLVTGVADGAMDVINLKISKVGGLTRARQIRDLAVSLGMALTIEDTWGGDYRNGDDRTSRAQHPDALPFLFDRLQQLRDRQHRDRRAGANKRTSRGVDRAGTWHHAAAGGSRQPRFVCE